MRGNMTDKQAAVSLKILALVADGKTPREALDAVLGAGTFETFAGVLYEALRAKAGVK